MALIPGQVESSSPPQSTALLFLLMTNVIHWVKSVDLPVHPHQGSTRIRRSSAAQCPSRCCTWTLAALAKQLFQHAANVLREDSVPLMIRPVYMQATFFEPGNDRGLGWNHGSSDAAMQRYTQGPPIRIPDFLGGLGRGLLRSKWNQLGNLRWKRGVTPISTCTTSDASMFLLQHDYVQT